MNQILVKQLDPKLEDSETASLSSGESQSNAHSSLVRDLYNNVVKQLKKNESKFNRITVENPSFSFQLYRPKLVSLGLRKDNLNGELLEKQLDRLMEDECKLDKQLSKISFEHQENEQLKQMEISNRIDHLSILRTVWNRASMTTKTDEKVDEINCRVAAIRNYIKMMAARENNLESAQLQKYVQDSREYRELKEKYDGLVSKIQIQESLYNAKIVQLQRQLQDLAQSKQETERKANDQYEKNKKRDEEICKLMQKCQYLELESLRKEKELKRSSKQNSQQKFEPESLGKKIKFMNKSEGFSVYVISEALESDSNQFTIRTLNEIKSYLTTSNVLQNLIESKVFNIPFCYEKVNNGFLEKLELKRANSKRKNTMERKEEIRSEVMLGSQDKRKRFERTKLLQFQ